MSLKGVHIYGYIYVLMDIFLSLNIFLPQPIRHLKLHNNDANYWNFYQTNLHLNMFDCNRELELSPPWDSASYKPPSGTSISSQHKFIITMGLLRLLNLVKIVNQFDNAQALKSWELWNSFSFQYETPRQCALMIPHPGLEPRTINLTHEALTSRLLR